MTLGGQAHAAGTACFRLAADAASGCTGAPAQIEITNATPFELAVVYQGDPLAGITLDFDFVPGDIGTITAAACSQIPGELPPFDAITINGGNNITHTYFDTSKTSAPIEQFFKCTFPGGSDKTSTITWKTLANGGTAEALDATGSPVNITFTNANLVFAPKLCNQITTNSTITATGRNVGGAAQCDVTWTAPAGAGTGENCALTATPYALTQNGTAVTGSPFGAGTTSFAATGLTFDQTYTFGLTTSTEAGALTQVTATCTPRQGVAPEMTITVPTSALAGSPLTLNGTYNDSDSNTVTITVFYRFGSGTIKSTTASTSARSASATSGNWTATIPGADVLEGQQLKIIAQVVDDIGLKAFVPNVITEADFAAGLPTAEAFDKVNCSGANAPCIAGDNIIVGTALAFADTNGDSFPNLPVPSEMPFNPADGNEPSPTRPGLDILFSMNAASRVTARIYTLNGRLIRQLPPSNTTFLPNTCHYLQGCNWDGTDFGQGTTDFVPNGLYIINIQAVCNTSNEPEGTCPTAFTSKSLSITKGIVVMK